MLHHDKTFDRVTSVFVRILLFFPLSMVLYGITDKIVFFWIGVTCVSLFLLYEIWSMCYAVTSRAIVSVFLTAVIVYILFSAFVIFVYPGLDRFPGKTDGNLQDSKIEENIETNRIEGDTQAHGVYVYVTEHGGKYHKADCRYAENWVEKMAIENAIDAGYEPCKVCNP